MFDIQTRVLLFVNINTCSISIDKYICLICDELYIDSVGFTYSLGRLQYRASNLRSGEASGKGVYYF